MTGWRAWWRRWQAVACVGDSGLADEAEAFLDGRLLEVMRAGGCPVTSWMWLNAVAHGDPERVVWLASSPAAQGPHPLDWPAARARVAAELVGRTGGDPFRMTRLQHAVLVPLELVLATRPGLTPDELVAVVASELGLAQR